MIQFKYGHNKGAKKAAAAPAAAASKAAPAAAAPAAKVTWTDVPNSPAMKTFAAEAVAAKVGAPACYMDCTVEVRSANADKRNRTHSRSRSTFPHPLV